MTDEEYLFRQTSAERKRIGRGDFNKKRKGGRFVRLPSDHLSKKEKEKMNGEVMSYNMNVPVAWAEFKKWPQDLACEYIRRLEEAYNVRTEDIAGMMGIGPWSLRLHRRELGCPAAPGGKRKPVDRVGWAKFIGGDDDVRAVLGESSPEVAEKVEPPEKKEENPEPIKVDSSSIMNIAILLEALKGSGAKLTIEVTL
jgi:hypothetical protein